MSKLKILLRGIQSNLFSFFMVFFSTLFVVVLMVVNFSFEQSTVRTRIDQLGDMCQNTPISVIVADAWANQIAARAANQAASQITLVAGEEANRTDASQSDTAQAEESQDGSRAAGMGAVFEASQVKDILILNNNIAGYVERYSFGANTRLKFEYVSVYGVDIPQQRGVYDIDLLEGTLDFAEVNGVIVSKTFARENSVNLGDTFKIYLNQPGGRREVGAALAQRTLTQGMRVLGVPEETEGQEQKETGQKDPGIEVVIKAIAADTGFFQAQDELLISKLAFAQSIHKQPGKINFLDVALKDLGLVSQTLEQLNGSFRELNLNLEAGQKYDDDYYDTFVKPVVFALYLFVGFMVLVSVYILLSVFRSYVYQNMNEMVTLRSVGFTIQRYRVLVMWQVSISVLIAAGIGLALSPLCTRLLWSWALQEEPGVVEVNWIAAGIVVAGALGIALLSAWLATKKVTETPIVDILKKNLVQKKGRIRGVQCALGLSLGALAVGALILRASFPDLGVLPYFAAIGLALVGFILLHDSVVYGFSRLIEKLFGGWGRALGLFAKQLKFNCTSYTQSISILSLVLVVSTLTVSISSMLDKALGGIYEGADLGVNIYSETYEPVLNVLDKNGLSYVMQKRGRTSLENKSMEISGVPVDKYIQKNYERVKDGSREEVFGGLKNPGTIVMTTTFSKANNKGVGDKVTVEGGEYTIVGIVSSFENMGNIAFVSEETFKKMFGGDETDFYCCVLVETSTVAATGELLRSEVESGDVTFSMYSIEELRKEYVKSGESVIKIIYTLCVFSLLLSTISMVSNLIVNMVSRKSDFVIYRTIGITKGKIRKSVLYEALSMGIYSGVTGIGIGCALLPVLASVLSYYVGAIEPTYNFPLMGALLGLACVISILSVLFTIRKYVFKTNLVEEVKRV
ncbi:MAG: FtsX-like permease family protein [Peptococcaceae bacterium]|nr:FtsX-like permease family protein [Peptococcaceae bacterium]